MTGSDGKTYGMVCIPVEKLALWLATINPNRPSDGHLWPWLLPPV